MPLAHFWMGTGVTLGTAAVLGLGLGSYVTSPQAPARTESAMIDTAIDDDGVQEAGLTNQKGPGVIHCTGCGPTLAERRWKADMAGGDAAGLTNAGYDPLTEDHVAEVAFEPPAPVQALPPQVVRFASGDTPPPDVAMTRERQEAAAPPPVEVPAAAQSILPQ